MMRTLHADKVDNFIQQVGLGDEYTHRVAARADEQLMHRYVRWIGSYNEITYRCIFFPFMREHLAREILLSLAEAPDQQAFVKRYRNYLIELLKASDYEMSGWFAPKLG